MRLVTFHHSGRGDRVGAVASDGSIVDLNAAYALYLRNVQGEGAFYALADARVPAGRYWMKHSPLSQAQLEQSARGFSPLVRT